MTYTSSLADVFFFLLFCHFSPFLTHLQSDLRKENIFRVQMNQPVHSFKQLIIFSRISSPTFLFKDLSLLRLVSMLICACFVSSASLSFSSPSCASFSFGSSCSRACSAHSASSSRLPLHNLAAAFFGNRKPVITRLGHRAVCTSELCNLRSW